MNKRAAIRISLNSGKSMDLQGEIIRYEPVEGRKDLAALAIKYDPASITLEYKMLINDYLKHAGRAAAIREKNK